MRPGVGKNLKSLEESVVVGVILALPGVRGWVEVAPETMTPALEPALLGAVAFFPNDIEGSKRISIDTLIPAKYMQYHTAYDTQHCKGRLPVLDKEALPMRKIVLDALRRRVVDNGVDRRSKGEDEHPPVAGSPLVHELDDVVLDLRARHPVVGVGLANFLAVGLVHCR